jgi:hypothetical protein
MIVQWAGPSCFSGSLRSTSPYVIELRRYAILECSGKRQEFSPLFRLRIMCCPIGCCSLPVPFDDDGR